MNTHTNKKVVCIKDIPSNLIEEAIFILKSDGSDIQSQKLKSTRKEIILKETEELVSEYSNEFEKMEYENEENINVKSNMKLKIVLGAVLLVLICYLVSLVI